MGALLGARLGMVASAGAASQPHVSRALLDRPGLGTSAGYSKYSRMNPTQFYRQSGVPTAVDSFQYNDEPGAKAMADLLAGGSKHGGLFKAAGERLSTGLVNLSGSAFPHLEAKGKRIVVGEAGRPYSVRLDNRTAKRLEVLVSVDGINTLTGQTAGYAQRGFVVDAHKSIVIDGYRVNDSRSRQFLFGGVADSKAAQSGQARNVGVIGLAVFEEDEAKAKMMLQREQLQRDDASAFPASQR